MFCDNLMLLAPIGNFTLIEPKSKGGEPTKVYYLYTNHEFSIYHNDHNVLEVNMSTASNDKVELPDKDTTVKFTYSVTW